MRRCIGIAALCLSASTFAAEPAPGNEVSAPGPRGPVGPGVPLADAEKEQFARRVVAEARTAAGIQAACDRAAKEGVRTVFLPAGEYVLDATVRVPAGLVVLGEGAATLCKAGSKDALLFAADGDGVRLTRLKLLGADTTPSTKNDSFGITVARKQNVRIDHCEFLGFSYATNFADEATAQVDHCSIHHNLRDGLGYGVAIYSGAYVLLMDNDFAQNRHSLASNGALDWSSPKRLGRYVHKPGVRKTHWELVHNRVGSNDQSPNELCAVDTHPGMDGTFVIEGNLFEDLRHAIGIRDGSGLIRGNLFRNFRGKSFRTFVAVSIAYGTHNDVPVEGCMPHDIRVEGNTYVAEGAKYEKHSVGKAENVTLDGQLVPSTNAERPAPPPLPQLVPMDAEGRLGIRERKAAEGPSPKQKEDAR